MEDTELLIDAINRLTIAVSETNLLSIVISTILSTIGSVIAVFLVEAIKERTFVSMREFRDLRLKVDRALTFYANYYTNVIDLAKLHSGQNNPVELQKWMTASYEIRGVAADVRAFVDVHSSKYDGKSFAGLPMKDISETADLLMGLSNSLFTPYGCSHESLSMIQQNKQDADKIKVLLGIS